MICVVFPIIRLAFLSVKTVNTVCVCVCVCVCRGGVNERFFLKSEKSSAKKMQDRFTDDLKC